MKYFWKLIVISLTVLNTMSCRPTLMQENPAHAQSRRYEIRSVRKKIDFINDEVVTKLKDSVTIQVEIVSQPSHDGLRSDVITILNYHYKDKPVTPGSFEHIAKLFRESLSNAEFLVKTNKGSIVDIVGFDQINDRFEAILGTKYETVKIKTVESLMKQSISESLSKLYEFYPGTQKPLAQWTKQSFVQLLDRRVIFEVLYEVLSRSQEGVSLGATASIQNIVPGPDSMDSVTIVASGKHAASFHLDGNGGSLISSNAVTELRISFPGSTIKNFNLYSDLLQEWTINLITAGPTKPSGGRPFWKR